MHYKLLSNENNFVLDAEQKIYQIVGNKLSKEEIVPIVEAYYWRLDNDPNFNSEHFFLDLKGYIKYFLLEKYRITEEPFAPGSVRLLGPKDLFMNYPSWGKGDELNLLFKYNFINNMSEIDELVFSFGKFYFIERYNALIRFNFYRPSPEKFLYQKLMGTSQADLSKALGNDLFVIKTTNIPGEPMEIIEPFLPMTDVYLTIVDRYMNIDEEVFDDEHDLLCVSFMQKIAKRIDNNILFKEMIRTEYAKTGLVVRLDEQRNKRVYPVVTDLNFKQTADSCDPQSIKKIKQLQANVQPDFLNYDDLINDLPHLSILDVEK